VLENSSIVQRSLGEVGKLAPYRSAEGRSGTGVKVSDLLMGAVNYEFKLKNKLILSPNPAKVELLEHIKNKLKVNSLACPLRKEKFNIILFNPAIKKNLQAMGPTANALQVP
jgi:hypothetical protein